jgi:CheY-like chemotaxis protein
LRALANGITTLPAHRTDEDMASPLHTLLVDDSAEDTELLLAHFRRHGYDVQWERGDTEDALCAALARQAWDIALCDYIMPRDDVLGSRARLAEHGDIFVRDITATKRAALALAASEEKFSRIFHNSPPRWS